MLQDTRDVQNKFLLAPFSSSGVISKYRLGYVGSTSISDAIEQAASWLDCDIVPISVNAIINGAALSTNLLWVDITKPSEKLIKALAARSRAEHISLVVRTDIDQLDTVFDSLEPLKDVHNPSESRSATTILVEATASQAAAALVPFLRNVSSTVHAERPGADVRDRQIENLQEEVQRISRMLSRLAMQPDVQREPPSPFIDDHVSAKARAYYAGPSSTYDGPTLSAQDVRQIIRQRRLRDEMFDGELFADPAWDMFLDLYAAKLDRSRVSVSSLCIAAAVPATTALRWIKTLTSSGHLNRRADTHDARRIFVELSDQTTLQMNRYFARLSDPKLAI